MPAYTASHWGIYEVEGADATAVLKPWREDGDPSPIGLHMLAASRDPLRITRPAVRRGWLERRRGAPQSDAGAQRGRDTFIEVSWEEAIELAGGAIRQVRSEHGNRAIFGGSAGWASAGRFHHAQSQLHRFLNCAGGYVRSVDSYSNAAATVLLPHVVASMPYLTANHSSWDVLERHTELFVSFGGVPAKNAQITNGGAGRHRLAAALEAMRARGVAFVNVSPTRDDLRTGGEVQWLPLRPNTDTALMLALSHTLLAHGWHAADFVERYCSGYAEFSAYLLGRSDGVVKNAQWAAPICGIDAAEIVTLARRMKSSRTMLNASWSLQRARHGEQPYWALLALASMLGQIGLPGGGFGVGYGAMNAIGNADIAFPGPVLPQGRNAVAEFIPVARLTDMLLHPGQSFTYNGAHYRYPDVKLVYWAGGNPFHHHQDLNRLRDAWQKPDTIIVHEQFWNPQARMADIVLPATTTLEREDLAFAARERHLVSMRRVQAAPGEALDDFEILRRLSVFLGCEPDFTGGLDTRQWQRRMYDETRDRAAAMGVTLPEYAAWREQGLADFDYAPKNKVMLADFRRDPALHPLSTPTGRIVLYSPVIAAFGLSDCPGHPAWLEPEEWLGAALAAEFPLHLISDQPALKLHSQLDHSALSRAGKRDGRELLRIHPREAAERGLAEGDAVRVYNRRGAVIAIVQPDDGVAAGVARLPTGAWADPWYEGDASVDKHGNPNVLTSDRPSSGLSQACAALSCLVQVRRWDGAPPVVTAFDLPVFSHAPAP